MGFSATITVVSAALILGMGHTDTKLQSLKDALQACARLPDSTARLSCFEDLAKSSAQGTGQAAVPAKGEAPGKAPLTATEQRTAAKAKASQTRQAYDAVVLRAWKSGIGDYYVALTNGEIWKSQAGEIPRPVKEGEAVTLHPGAIGGWFIEFKTVQRPELRVILLE